MKLQVLDQTTFSFNSTLFNPTAHYYGEPYWLKFVGPHLREIGIDIVLTSFDKIDKSKKWLVSLAPLGWNWSEYKDDIIAEFPYSMQDGLINGNGYLIINHECESFTNTFFLTLHKKLENSRIPPNKIIYMVGAGDAKREYERFAEQHGIKKDKQIEILTSFHVYRRIEFDLKDFLIDFNSVKERKFLSLNRTGKLHRLMLIGSLTEHDILDQGFVSLGITQDDLPTIVDELKVGVPELPKYIWNGIDKISPLLPLKVDNVDLNVNQFKVNSLPSEFYEKTCFSLVTSTFALALQENSSGLTEKEIKPILYKHPFIIYNRPGVLKHLKSQGFMTFDKWFDESYDEEHDDILRLEKIVNEVKRLSEISFEDWKIITKEMLPVLFHNYNRLVNYNTEHVFFTSDLKNLLYYVT